MSSRVEKAADMFSEGYNCAQAGFSAFSPAYGTEEGQREMIDRDLLNTVCAVCVRDAAAIVGDLVTDK